MARAKVVNNMSKKNKKLILKTPKEKIEELANEFEKNPETADLSMVLFVIAGSTLLGKDAIQSLALWNATWAESVVNEVNKMREEDSVDDITDKIILPGKK